MLISSDVTATRVLPAVPERIFSRPFSEQSSELPFQNFDCLYNKKTKMNFQKLISKPFSTCLNMSNKLNLSKRCS